MNRYRTTSLVLIAAGVALTTGCAKVETHVYVEPEGGTEMAFAFRLPVALAAMLTGALEGATPSPQEGQLPPGIEFSERDEGAEHVWELRMSGPMDPSRLVCRVTTAERLLTTSYDLVIDPRNANPFGALGEEGDTSPAGLAISALGVEGLTEADADPPNELGEALEGLEERFGGMVPAADELDVGKLMEQIQPALYAHLPGRLTESNGERVDDSTARWAFTPESLMEGPKRLTASSELAEMAMIGDLVNRLNAHHGTDVTPEKMAEIVQRGFVPNPAVEDRTEAVVDSHLYGELVIAVTGLEAAVGSEKAEAVMRALNLLQPEPSLARATMAAKRLPRIREREDRASLTVEEIVALLSDEAE